MERQQDPRDRPARADDASRHIRASSGSAVQQTNCHPFRHERWLWVFRYSSEHDSRTLCYSSTVQGLRKLYPDDPVITQMADDDRLVVSEPLRDLPGAWNELPDSSYGIVHSGHDGLRIFRPQQP